MTLKGLEPRLRQLGRIRLGQKNDKGNPTRLSTWRLTSSDRQVLIDAASLYGGTPQPWQGAPTEGQWELITTTNALEIVLPPDRALSQSFELWNAGGCVRRCDGEWEQLADEACPCAMEETRACKPTTRLNVLLPNLPGLGVWRLDTHGVYAATELAGVVELVGRLRAFVNATLRIEQRTERKIVDGKAETRHFPVPVIDLDVTPGQIAGLTATPNAPQPAVAGPARPALESGGSAEDRVDWEQELAADTKPKTSGEALATSPGPTGRDLLGELRLSANEARRILPEKNERFRGWDIKAIIGMTGDDLAIATPILTDYQNSKAGSGAGS